MRRPGSLIGMLILPSLLMTSAGAEDGDKLHKRTIVEIERLFATIPGSVLTDIVVTQKEVQKHESKLLHMMKEKDEAFEAIAREYEELLRDDGFSMRACFGGKPSPLGIEYTAQKYYILPCLEDLVLACRPKRAVEMVRKMVIDDKLDERVRGSALGRLAAPQMGKGRPKMRRKVVLDSLHRDGLAAWALNVITLDRALVQDLDERARKRIKEIFYQEQAPRFFVVSTARRCLAAGLVTRDEYSEWVRDNADDRNLGFYVRHACVKELDRLDAISAEERKELMKQVIADGQDTLSFLVDKANTQSASIAGREGSVKFLREIGALPEDELQALQELIERAKAAETRED